MQTNSQQENKRQYTDEEIRQILMEQAKKDLKSINPDTLIILSFPEEITKPNENIRFGDLPLENQEGIRKGLESIAKGEVSRWEI
ncbi:hypothetical protein C7H19_21665 [Aphanothece hegewaldii CCALA 016]|uniref:Uncharacterized protein n=1 Tax=Aphanothece hegewaldii CCALA 016 TaxID=2107694 RepID=A0A2T1LS32_9CHRO|nr:hypothetical protein [Aphanothece hegewaldii]PSF32243.1 hypothetical protein C7H19_21665 [Aphanothece hegewaldii CCALA 016]